MQLSKKNLLQIDTMILMEMVKHFQSYQNSKFAISKKELEMKLIFCMQINIKMAYKLISTLGHQRLLQGDTNIIDEHDDVFSK